MFGVLGLVWFGVVGWRVVFVGLGLGGFWLLDGGWGCFVMWV